MPITPPDLLDLANILANNTTEAAYRAAVSRAYYFCYHYCQTIAEGLDEAGGIGVHETLIRKFTAHPSSKIKGIGYQLQQCRDMRVTADYHLEMDFGDDKAALAIMYAQRIQSSVDSLS